MQDQNEHPRTGGISLVRKAELARQLGVSTWTLDRWVKNGQFPRPIYATDNSPAAWRVRDIEFWLVKRSLKRRKRPSVRGRLKQMGGANPQGVALAGEDVPMIKRISALTRYRNEVLGTNVSARALNAYLDTVELFFRYLPTGLRAQIEPAYGRRVRIVDCKDRAGHICGYRLITHQPSIRVLRILHELQAKHGATLYRFDVAYDFSSQSREFMERCSKLLWRRAGPMLDVGSTVYSVEQKTRKRRSGRDLALYSDKPSKITGEVDVVHVELRFQNSAAVRRAGYMSPMDLTDINPRQMFKRHIKLVEFDAEAFKLKIIKAAVKEDREKYRFKETSNFEDKYRASIPRRVRSWLERFLQDRVQKAQDFHPKYVSRLKSISLDTLYLPECLSWAQNRNSTATSP